MIWERGEGSSFNVWMPKVGGFFGPPGVVVAPEIGWFGCDIKNILREFDATFWDRILFLVTILLNDAMNFILKPGEEAKRNI